MKVMQNHDFFDGDIEKVLMSGHDEVREIVLSDTNEGSIVFSKDDVIALAKEFNLLVFEKCSIL